MALAAVGATFATAGTARASCPNPALSATPSTPDDVVPHVSLAYFGTLNVFNVYWDQNWDSDNPFKTADIDKALQGVLATPYFDKLCQYGVPGFQWQGSTNTNRFLQLCPSYPGPQAVVFPQLIDFVSCEESAPGSGVPFSDGLPNPLTCASCTVPGVPCYIDPGCVATPNPTGTQIYNVFLSQTTHLAEAGSNCSNFDAFHFQIPSQMLPAVPGSQGRPIIFTVIPAECFTTLPEMIAAVTHEMDEAATDPLPPTSWFNSTTTNSGAPIGNIGQIFTDGEVADRCENDSATFFTAPNGVPVAVAPYWSNHDHRCVSIDETPPVTSIALSPAARAGWNDSSVTVTLTATDDDSGVAEIDFSASGAQTVASTIVNGGSASLTVSAEGLTTVSFHAVDNAGNVEGARTGAVRIDLTPPAISATRPPAPNSAGWNNMPVSVSFACSDALSGVASCSPPVTVSTEGANQSVTGTAVDVAGNQASVVVSPIDVDLSPPIIVGAAIPPANANGWNNTGVMVEFSCTDAVSGVSSCSAPVPLTSEGPNQQAAGLAVDLAGNAASVTVTGVNIDETPPVVTYAGNGGTYTVDQQVAIACNASDALSGLESTTCANVSGPAYGFGLGTQTDSANAVDRAGNEASATVQFTVIVTFDSLCSLTGELLSKPQLQNALCAKLQAASKASDSKTRANQLGAFKNQVEAQSGKALTSDQAVVLESLADALD
jgi:hypothetical protein